MKRVCSAGARRTPKAPAHTRESDAAWLARLASAHPGVNVEEELRRAARYVRQKRGEGARVSRKFFETQWLAGCVDQVDVRAAMAAAPTIAKTETPPEGWRKIVVGTNYGPGGLFETNEWAHLPEDVRTFVRRELAAQNAA